MKTTLAKNVKATDRAWLLVDAKDQVVGRLAVKIANLLRGRHKVTYTPHVDTGDYVVVINADKVKFSGNKEDAKEYMFYTGWVGTAYRRNAAHMRASKPEFILRHAVKGMLPKSKLGAAQLRKLKLYAGADHPHEAQQPRPLA